MEKPTSQLVEEAVNAVKKGEINLETGASRFGVAWLEIKSEVVLILDLDNAGQAFKTQLSAPNLDKIWAGILPELTLVQILPPQNKAPVSGLAGKNGMLSLVETEEPPAPKVVPLKKAASPTPAKVSFLKKWHKPLTWAAAISLFVILSMGSMVGVANASEPGDFFYGTKLWLDSSRAIIAFSPQDKVNVALSYCAHRSEEMEWLVKNGRLEYIPAVAGDYQQNLQKVVTSGATTLTSDQAELIKNQQTRLAQLNSQLGQKPTGNPTTVTQASQELDKLVQQLDKVGKSGQINPTPTVVAVTPTTGSTTTPSVSPATGTPGVSVTPAITGTLTVSTTAATGPTRTPGVTPGASGPAQTLTQGDGTAVSIPKEGNTTAPVGTGEIRVVTTPTSTPATVGSGSNQNDGNGEVNDNDEDDINGNNGNQATSVNQPATPPAATTTEAPKPEKTKNPATQPVTPVPPTLTPKTEEPKTEKAQETEKAKETKEPKTEKPKDTPKPKK